MSRSWTAARSEHDQVKALRIEGRLPALEHIADQSYHLVHPFYLLAPQEPAGTARQFVDFCLSAQGQSIVARRYVPVRPAEP